MNLIIIGGGDNTGALIDLINDNEDNVQIVGISDNNLRGSMNNGYPINFNDEEVLGELSQKYIIISYARHMEIRKKIFDYFSEKSASFATIISKRSYVSNTASIGGGSIIMPGVVIRNQAVIGRNTLINSNATIEHGCVVGSHCHIAPGAVLTGNVIIEDNCFVGANSTVLPNLKVEMGSVIGAGAVVTKNVPQNEIWVGNPAKKYEKVSGEQQYV